MPPFAAPPPSLPRLILEAAPDGALSAEFYINGARSRVRLERGFEIGEIRGILAEIANDIAAAAERKAARKEAEERARHNRIYQHSVNARGQGKDFADRVIGKPQGNTGPKAPKALLADASYV